MRETKSVHMCMKENARDTCLDNGVDLVKKVAEELLSDRPTIHATLPTQCHCVALGIILALGPLALAFSNRIIIIDKILTLSMLT